MHRGYIKFWRIFFDSGLHRNHKAWVLWTWILGNVTHRKIEYFTGNQMVTLLPGQVITGRKKLAADLAMSERNIRTCLQLLKRMGILTIKSTNKYSLLTVVDWTLYQEENSKTTNKPSSNRPAGDQQVTTKQEVKNVRSNIGGAKKTVATISPESIQFTETHKQLAEQLNLSLEDQWARYRDYHHANGKKRVNHDRAFNNWLRNCPKFDQGVNSRPLRQLPEAE